MSIGKPARGVIYGLNALVALYMAQQGRWWWAAGFAFLSLSGLALEIYNDRRIGR